MGNWLINLSQIWASYGLKGNHRKSGDIRISMEAGSLWWTKSGGLVNLSVPSMGVFGLKVYHRRNGDCQKMKVVVFGVCKGDQAN